ncbi:MAG TPA: chromosome partitioning protein ParB [Flavobacteriales bacterium]|nr:chromosome partitioning protein ParB [Flavobacteriales bacterium]
MTEKKPALGRGLSALLDPIGQEPNYDQHQVPTNEIGSVNQISVSFIEENPFQPRKHFERDALIELAESIATHGLIQPVTVRKMATNHYQLISGERRFRAAQAAGLTQIPAYVRVADDQAMLELAIVENIQREELDPIEVAIGYKRLIEECSLTQEELAGKMSKSRTNVTNFLRLLKLPPAVQLALREKSISMGHARAIVSLETVEEQLEMLNQMLSENLSVRDVETKVRERSRTNKNPQPPLLDFDEKLLLSKASLNVKKKIQVKKGKKGSGRIVLTFDNAEEFQTYLRLLAGE